MEQNHPIEPWEQDSYETGSTKPPKSRGGVIAVLLVAVIFLGGICSALGIMNIKLFHKLNAADSDLAFHEDPGSTLSTDSTGETVYAGIGGDVSVDLNKAPGQVENVPQTGGLSLQQIYEKNIASVVSVSCNTGSGTGVVLSEDGYIITNCHVIDGASKISILFSDGRTLPAAVVGSDAVSDLAVLYVEASDLTPAEFGDSNDLRVGDAVAAIGDPLGIEYRGTMTDGIVSAINRNVTTGGRTMTLIQTNAALNSGNSGGPLINCYGQVIGINTLKIGVSADAAGVEGLGFAIPSTTVKEVVEQLISQGYVSGRPSLELKGQTITVLEQRYYRVPAGVLVTELEKNGCSDKAGIDTGDILLSIAGQRIASVEEMEQVLYTLKPGDRIEIIFYRGGKQYSAMLNLAEATI